MSNKAIYAYAWDLAEAGVAETAGQFRRLGLDTVSIAGGVTELAFYNWGHLRGANVEWIGEALALLKGG